MAINRNISAAAQWDEHPSIAVPLLALNPQLTADGYWVFTRAPADGKFQDSGDGYNVLAVGETTGKKITKHATGALYIY